MTRSDAMIHKQAASIKILETQVGQLAEAHRSKPQGALPSNTEVPKKNGEEQVNAISLRSGKAIDEPEVIKNYHEQKQKALNQNKEDKVAEEVENHDQPKEPQVAGTENIAIVPSINLMPKSIFRKLEIGEARPTTVTLLMVDRSLTYPEGKFEDVLVRVDKFIFPADFIVLDFEADREVPIILGRAFLATG
ncbi:uncharacterized protein LOC133301261 [Gastrolobium bilobum]|uniref:uncharacterized protein LOC133292412 n=1 Tax=Gastrolobium bilobum TaxID=150636 RepID=UPI002AB0F231|nr:uncharacterized protein LOC133292412 [Gastrolobium bilobum]XP_061356863.1 uncharacterized protein LOC133301261 [Gastrolobium bilobum]